MKIFCRKKLRVLVLLWSACLIIVRVACVAQAPPADKPGGASGSTTGTIVEITDEWVLIRGTNGIPLRHWFKWAGSTNAALDPALQSTVTKLKEGDTVQVLYSSAEGRELIESLTLVRAAASEPENPKQIGRAHV